MVGPTHLALEVPVHVHILGPVPVQDPIHVTVGLLRVQDHLIEVQVAEAIIDVIILGHHLLHTIEDLLHHRVVIGPDLLLQDAELSTRTVEFM